MKRLLIKHIMMFFMLAVACPGKVKSQLAPIYSQYMVNYFTINPAATGADGYTIYNLTAREQWIGFKDPPRTHAFNFQTRLLKREYDIKKDGSVKKVQFKPSRSGRVGVGGSLFNDKSGLISRTGIQFTYAFHTFNLETQYSFGISASLFQLRIKDDEFEPHDKGDPLLNSGLNNVLLVPDAIVGFNIADHNYFGGISAANLFQSLKIGNNTLKDYRVLRHYYLNGGYTFYPLDDFIFEPSFLVKTTESFNFQNDLSLKCYFQDLYWATLSYRTLGTVILSFGFNIDNLFFGYAFDYPLNTIRRHSFGSHEFVVSLKIGDSSRRYKWKERY